MSYADFLEQKRQLGGDHGFAPTWVPDFLYPFQASLVEWATRKGRAAIFADCGLGKTPMQLVWAENVAQHTDKPVLIATPLAVSQQTVAEADKFGVDAVRSQDGSRIAGHRIVVTNYERLDRFNATDFAGMVCDESSILKNYDGVRRGMITEFMRMMPYRLLCTATAAPNDYTELGTSSEALGYMGHIDMLQRFFRNNQNTQCSGRFYGQANKWSFKGHAREPFWRWVCSWARACRKPSDIGFDDDRFTLPALVEREHLVSASVKRDGWLFEEPAIGLREERDESRRSIRERCERVAELVDHDGQALVWCHLNPEGDLLSRLIPGAAQVKGGDSDELKEERLRAFADGQLRVLVTKPKIGAWGLNLQRCQHITFFPTHSYEQYYQGVRRCWRFGQDKPVTVDIVTTEGGRGTMANLQRKSAAADEMFASLVQHMSEAMGVKRPERELSKVEVPQWLQKLSA
jgi:ERCC4-related helicase